MYHPLPMPPEAPAEFGSELGDRAADLPPERAPAEALLAPSYRSEAFAEDLSDLPPPPGVPTRRLRMLLGLAVPACAALLGVAAVMVGAA